MSSDKGEALRDALLVRHNQKQDYERLIRWYFPSHEHSRAIWVAWQVSGMNAGSYHPRDEYGIGLFDLDPIAVGLAEGDAWRLMNPIVNVAAALRLWMRQGWRPWNLAPWPEHLESIFDKEG